LLKCSFIQGNPMDFETLFAKRANHIKPGLERIRRSYDFLQNPAQTIPGVLVGGTNGKGSTSGFIWSLLALSGKAIGLYSSPHLVDFSERFQVSGVEIDDAAAEAALLRLKTDLTEELFNELSFFEIATLLGFRIFEEQRAAFQVLEVGLGGRWDASNISDPLASIVVSVSRDHKEFLGNDLLGILGEKLGISRQGRPLFWGAQGEVMDEPLLQKFLDDHVAKTGVILYSRGREFYVEGQEIKIHLPGLSPLSLQLEGILKDLPEYLKNNLSLSAAFYHWFVSQPEREDWPKLDEIWPLFCQGKTRAPITLAGRAQRVLSRTEPQRRFLIDVCHNPDGARAFAAAIKALYPQKSMPAYVSILKDKDHDTILDILRSVLHPVILFGIENERSWDLSNLAARHSDLKFYASLEEAQQASAQRADQLSEPWAICGSVAAVGYALKLMKVSPKELSLASIISGDWSPYTDKP
jgi:dihydrofolate synthase/folylpolyglutamate synthase